MRSRAFCRLHSTLRRVRVSHSSSANARARAAINETAKLERKVRKLNVSSMEEDI